MASFFGSLRSRLQRVPPMVVDSILAVLLVGAVTAAISVAPEQQGAPVSAAYPLGPVLGALSHLIQKRSLLG